MFDKYKIFIFTSNPDKLVKFYTDVLGFKILKKLEYPKDYGYMVEVQPGYEIWIAKHSKVKGKNKDKYRIIINFYSNQIQKIYDCVSKAKAKIIMKPTPMNKFVPEESRYVLTFEDPEQNLLQVMGYLNKL